MTFRRSHRRSGPRLVALLLPVLAAWACGPAREPPSGAGVVPAPWDPAPYEAEARARLAREGLDAARVVVAGPSEWRRAADGAASLAETLARLGWSDLRVEPRGGSFCARARGVGDCLFVSVVGPAGADPDLRGVSPAGVDAVAWVEPSVPAPGDTRMSWREELRTGRLVFFLRGW